MTTWRCRLCGYEHDGSSPPKECPQCSSSQKEFVNASQKKASFGRKEKFDVLLVNGSSHSSHNSSILADIAEKELKKRKVSYHRLNLNEFNIMHCWCCYSMYDAACTYPCRNQLDDMPLFHDMILNSRAVIVVSPINWNNMSARLKDFLDRLTCIQNVTLLGKKSLTVGKAFAALINGHEDGALKTALDIFVYFQQMGYIFVPYGFAYRTHGAMHNASKDNGFFGTDRKLKSDICGVVGNVVETIRLDLEPKMRGRMKGVSE